MNIWSPIYSIIRKILSGLQRPQEALRREGNPLIRAIKIALAEWQFTSSQVDMFHFVASVTRKPVEEVKRLGEEIKSLDNFKSTEFNEPLYLIARMLVPDVIVETGIASGRSSASILLALEHNNKGGLHSIDLSYDGQSKKLKDGSFYTIPDGKSIGWTVPVALRHRWHLILGDATTELPTLLRKLGKIDLFIHDSLHTEQHMMFEYQTAWPFIRTKGVLLSHDISFAFLQFSKKVNRPYHCFGYWYAKYGAIIK